MDKTSLFKNTYIGKSILKTSDTLRKAPVKLA